MSADDRTTADLYGVHGAPEVRSGVYPPPAQAQAEPAADSTVERPAGRGAQGPATDADVEPAPALDPESGRAPDPEVEPERVPDPAVDPEPERGPDPEVEPGRGARPDDEPEPAPGAGAEVASGDTSEVADGVEDEAFDRIVLDPQRYRERWDEVQAGFVDEPRRSVSEADLLVAEVIDEVTAGFAAARADLEDQWSGGGDASTEDLRVALQRYRTFFRRLLST